MLRRSLCVSTLLPAGLAARPFTRPLGLNLYTVRGLLAKDAASTYKRIGQLGITTLEVRPPNLLQHAALMRDAGLKPVHMFIEPACITGAWDEWREFGIKMSERMKLPAPPANAPRPTLEQMLALAKAHGIQCIGTSLLLPTERETAIARFNAAAERCAQAGVELYYHNHSYEFGGERGRRYLDRLHRELDPRIRLELDLFWAAISGDDPAAVLRQWKGRVKSVHLKDVAPGAARPADEFSVPPSAFRAAGAGALNWNAILAAAEEAQVEHYIIELDYTPGDPLESVSDSIGFLRRVQF